MGSDITVWLARVDAPSDGQPPSHPELTLPAEARRGHRDRSENAHRALRLVLSAYTGIPAQDLSFSRLCTNCGSQEHGKPRLDSKTGQRPPSFSMARNQRFAAIAVCGDGEIGVDLEDTSEPPPGTGAWAHPNEELLLESLPPIRAQPSALRLWVRREAVLKAMGVGLGDHARDLDLSRLPARLTGWVTVSAAWHLTDLDNPDRLIISLAAARTGRVSLQHLVHEPPSQLSGESPTIDEHAGDVRR